MKPRPSRAALVLVLLLAAAVVPGFSLSVTELDGNLSMLFIGSNPQTIANHGQDPSMTIAPLIGVSIPLRLSGPFFIEPGLEFLGTYYDWNGSGAQMTQAESGTGFFTVGALLSIQAGASFALSPVISMGGSVGLDFLVRFPFELQNTSATVQNDEGSALGWFYGAARFIYPETRLFVRWHISEPVDLVFNVRGFYPVFHLWDGSGQPFWDALMVSAGVGFGVQLGKLGAAPAAPATAAPAPAAPAAPAEPAPAAPAAPAAPDAGG